MLVWDRDCLSLIVLIQKGSRPSEGLTTAGFEINTGQ